MLEFLNIVYIVKWKLLCKLTYNYFRIVCTIKVTRVFRSRLFIRFYATSYIIRVDTHSSRNCKVYNNTYKKKVQSYTMVYNVIT